VASPPTPGASAVPALMSSTPFSPWIRTSESILRYRPLAGGDGIGHTVQKFLAPDGILSRGRSPG
jgi:hypothetical protein